MSIKDRTDLTVAEAAGIIAGHGIGAGILSVPYLAAHCSVPEALAAIGLSCLFNILLHLMISELSLNNGGAQFVKCFERELIPGRLRSMLSSAAFVLIGGSVLVNVSAYLTGAAAAFGSWFGMSDFTGMMLFYLLCTAVVFFGAKVVGICEKYAVAAMAAVSAALLAATLFRDPSPLPQSSGGAGNALALYGMVSFSLSAVMSTPQVVRGLGCRAEKVRPAIAAGVIANTCIILLLTAATLIGTGGDVTEDGAMVDLARHMGSAVSVAGYVFTILALATSFWANTIDLRDIISEQFRLDRNLSWLAATVPPLVLALAAESSFVRLSRFAGVILAVTGFGIILAYARSRARTGKSEILGVFGTLPFRAAVVICALAATAGAVVKLK